MIEMKRRKALVLGIFLPRGGVGGWVKAWCEWSLPKYLLSTSFVHICNRHWIGQFGLYFLFGCFSIFVYSNMTCKIWAYCCYIHKSYLPICQHCLHYFKSCICKTKYGVVFWLQWPCCFFLKITLKKCYVYMFTYYSLLYNSFQKGK